MKKKLMKIYSGVVLAYGIVAIVIALIYLFVVGFVGADVNTNLVRAAVWFGLGLLVINGYIPKKSEDAENRLFFNQWVEYNTYEDFVNGSNGTTSNYSGTVIQTPTSITISYLDKFGVKTFIYMRTFNEDRMDYFGLDNTWVRPFLSVRGLRIEDKFIRLNYNQTMLTQT